MTSSDKEVEEQLLEAGNKIEDPPTSVEELLSLLDKIDSLLAKVEQSPSKSVHNALNPSRKALVSDQLLRHSDIDVKVAVAACISEITRITAPEAPYTDEQMKEVFHLIVSSFENLSDKSSRSYGKRASILETVAKVRSCVVMLDLECDGLIIEMFQHFLKTARDYHPENVFSSMETIMSLVLEESEDISVELLSPILASVKKENEEVLPIARKLGERVLNNCSAKLKPYLVQAVKTLGISFDDYSDVVASICKELSDSLEPNNLHDAGENVVEGNPTEVATPERVDVAIEKHHDSVKSNGIAQGGEDGSFTDTEKKEEEHGSEESKEVKSPKCSEPAKLDSEKASTAKAKPAKISKKRGRKSNQSLKSTLLSENSHVDTKKESENLPQQESCGEEHPSSPHGVQSAETLPLENEKVEVKPSSPKVTEIESANVASPSRSGSLPDDGNSKNVGLTKKKDNSAREVTSSADDVSRKLPEGVSDSDVKLDTHAEEKPPAGISDENKTASEEDAAERESDTSSNSEAKTLKQSARKVDKTSKGSSRPLKQSEAKKRQGPGISDENKTASDEDAGERESDTSSNSEAKTLKQSVRKVDKTSKGSSGPLKQLEAKKRQGPGKSVSGKAMKKLSGDHDKKETVTSPKPTLKTIKDEKVLDNATKASSSKRKRTPGKEKDSESTKFDETLVGSKIQVWWPKDRMFYEGVVEDYDRAKKKHKVLYMDGDTEVLNLKKERWEFIDDESGSEREQTTDLAKPESAMDIPQKKKAKLTANESAKRGKMDGSPKKGGVTSSSKSKGTTVKPDRSSGSKVESKSKENLSKAVKSSTITGSKSKDHASRATGKTGNVAPKNANKSRNDLDDTDSHKTSKSSKDDETHTPVASAKSKQDISKTGKSKQETPKTPTFSKGKSSKTGDRSNNSNISTKVKFTSSKSKEGGDSKNNTASAKTTENSKGKSLNSSNDQGGESKTGKKRRREAKG